MIISHGTQACFGWALTFILIGFFFRFYLPRVAEEIELLQRLENFRHWVILTYGEWLGRLDYAAAGICVCSGLARLLIWHL